jgi:hypothetical protein
MIARARVSEKYQKQLVKLVSWLTIAAILSLLRRTREAGHVSRNVTDGIHSTERLSSGFHREVAQVSSIKIKSSCKILLFSLLITNMDLQHGLVEPNCYFLQCGAQCTIIYRRNT